MGAEQSFAYRARHVLLRNWIIIFHSDFRGTIVFRFPTFLHPIHSAWWTSTPKQSVTFIVQWGSKKRSIVSVNGCRDNQDMNGAVFMIPFHFQQNYKTKNIVTYFKKPLNIYTVVIVHRYSLRRECQKSFVKWVWDNKSYFCDAYRKKKANWWCNASEIKPIGFFLCQEWFFWLKDGKVWKYLSQGEIFD